MNGLLHPNKKGREDCFNCPYPDRHCSECINQAEITPTETCKWHKDGQHMPDHDYWETSCDNMFQFSVDGPHENHFLFCPYCGKPIEETLK